MGLLLLAVICSVLSAGPVNSELLDLISIVYNVLEESPFKVNEV